MVLQRMLSKLNDIPF